MNIYESNTALKRAKKANTKRYFKKVTSNNWIENACDVCLKGGMSRKIYEFQREHRSKGTICSHCSKKEDKQSL